jgi:hypothetical protein
MSYLRNSHTVIVSSTDYTFHGELTTDDAKMAKVAVDAFRAAGYQVGVMTESHLVSVSTVMTNQPYLPNLTV